ncbi:MAG: ribonuclease III [Candidatus Zixiibacteriota bacterium]|nr:MAG: ribonuclease III [candidate division Zixibacteria bacterium]
MSFLKKLKSLTTWTRSAGQDHLEKCQQLIGYRFRDPDLLELALTHRSYVRAGNHHLPSNERLEFLGDSVLGLAVAAKLYEDHPHKREGDLTKTKAMLVNELTLARIGQEIGLNQLIRLSPEEERTGGRERSSIVSDAVESVIGAVYIDSNFHTAADMVVRLIYSRKDSIIADEAQRNYKGDLLELAQGRGEGMPHYDIVSETGPDHDKTFHVIVSVNGHKLGEGWGQSKKEAEQRAAAQGLENYSHLPT